MLLEAAPFQVANQRLLANRRSGKRTHDFAFPNGARESSGSRPAYAVARGQAFGQRTAKHPPPRPVEGLYRTRARWPEIQLGVGGILDHRHPVTLRQSCQRALVLLGHAASKGILKRGYHDTGLDRSRCKRKLERVEVDAGARIGCNLGGSEPHPFEHLQRGIKGGGLNRDRVARSRYGTQTKKDRFQRPGGDHDVIGVDDITAVQIAQRDKPPQLRTSGGKSSSVAAGFSPLAADAPARFISTGNSSGFTNADPNCTSARCFMVSNTSKISSLTSTALERRVPLNCFGSAGRLKPPAPTK